MPRDKLFPYTSCESSTNQTLRHSKGSVVMSGQSTPAHGSFHSTPTPPATPNNSAKSTPHTQNRLVPAETSATTRKQQALTPRRQGLASRLSRRHVQVTIKTRILQKTVFAALLCIENVVISVAGGAELENTILSIPLRHGTGA